MTNHIEQMMATAGIEERITVLGCAVSIYDSDCNKKETGKCAKCEFAQIQNLGYPDFTAEKQLEIIKLIGLSDYNISIYKKVEGTISIAAEPNTYKYSYSATAQDFSLVLAQLTTELMKAGELDKEKVKGVLEGC